MVDSLLWTIDNIVVLVTSTFLLLAASLQWLAHIKLLRPPTKPPLTTTTHHQHPHRHVTIVRKAFVRCVWLAKLLQCVKFLDPRGFHGLHSILIINLLGVNISTILGAAVGAFLLFSMRVTYAIEGSLVPPAWLNRVFVGCLVFATSLSNGCLLLAPLWTQNEFYIQGLNLLAMAFIELGILVLFIAVVHKLESHVHEERVMRHEQTISSLSAFSVDVMLNDEAETVRRASTQMRHSGKGPILAIAVLNLKRIRNATVIWLLVVAAVQCYLAASYYGVDHDEESEPPSRDSFDVSWAVFPWFQLMVAFALLYHAWMPLKGLVCPSRLYFWQWEMSMMVERSVSLHRRASTGMQPSVDDFLDPNVT